MNFFRVGTILGFDVKDMEEDLSSFDGLFTCVKRLTRTKYK